MKLKLFQKILTLDKLKDISFYLFFVLFNIFSYKEK